MICDIGAKDLGLIAGGMCNCVAKSYFDGSGCKEYYYMGGISSLGLVTYANVCKDLIGNISMSQVGGCSTKWSVAYVGCFPQAEETYGGSGADFGSCLSLFKNSGMTCKFE